MAMADKDAAGAERGKDDAKSGSTGADGVRGDDICVLVSDLRCTEGKY